MSHGREQGSLFASTACPPPAAEREEAPLAIPEARPAERPKKPGPQLHETMSLLVDIVPVKAGELVLVLAAGHDKVLVRSLKRHCTVWANPNQLARPAVPSQIA